MSKVNKNVFSSIFYGIIYIFLPPAIISSGFWIMKGSESVLPSFLCALGIDLLVGYVSNSYFSSKIFQKNAELELAKLEYDKGHVIGISCANCGERNLVPLDLSIDGFECTKCKEKNKIFYEFRASTIMDLNREKVLSSIAANGLQGDDKKVVDVWNRTMDEG